MYYSRKCMAIAAKKFKNWHYYTDLNVCPKVLISEYLIFFYFQNTTYAYNPPSRWFIIILLFFNFNFGNKEVIVPLFIVFISEVIYETPNSAHICKKLKNSIKYNRFISDYNLLHISTVEPICINAHLRTG